jgi:hypothetical protein
LIMFSLLLSSATSIKVSSQGSTLFGI